MAKRVDKPSELGKRLKDARLAANLTLMGLQAATTVDVGQISKFERGQFATLSPNLQKVAEHLNVDTTASDAVPTDTVVRLVERIVRGRHDRAKLLETILSAVDELDQQD